MTNNIIDILNSPLISGLSNAGQLLDVALDFTEMSSDEVLKRLLEEFKYQNNKYLISILKYCERILIENNSKAKLDKQLLENQNTLIEQNKTLLLNQEKIISLLEENKLK